MFSCGRLSLVILLTLFFMATSATAQASKIENSTLLIDADPKSGAYTIREKDNPHVLFSAAIAAEIDHHWLRAGNYPQHEIKTSSFNDKLGAGSELAIVYTGAPAQPDLRCTVRLPANSSFAEIAVVVQNTTSSQITVQNIRPVEAQSPYFALDGPLSVNRILSDSFSEDRPDMKIHDFVDTTDGMHRAVGSQLIYNRQSRQSLFLGALSSEKWLTVLRLHVDEKQGSITGYEVDSTGTMELEKENSLRESPAEDQIELSLPVDPGQTLAAEPLMASLSSDYHAQLETYGHVIRQLHEARVTAPTPIGWWSWTAYYFGLTEGPALTNAEFLSQNLLGLGYSFFHIDEGYQFARGDYTSIVAGKYPHGLQNLEKQVQALGLTPGIWTAPFEIAERSSIFTNHKDWLVHNAKGEPIHAGWVLEPPDAVRKLDQLYVLDTTNPAAQQYLRETYTTLVKDWGIRYIKLDFMDDTAIEGYYYHPNTTALEAQRIGLQVIRDAVGDGVLLDKDGSVMLNPVGIVDTGRISCDTGHTFEASRDAAPGIAARYYMNRNFYVSDPDAFSVSDQAYAAQQDHGGARELTLSEAQVAIALAAVSGGMLEIGDDLPTLSLDADRMALLHNRDLLNMSRYGHASTPIDLMSYAPEDEMPSLFLVHESKRQSILTVFNWTEKERMHELMFSSLAIGPHHAVSSVFGKGATVAEDATTLSLKLPPHSVTMLKIVDTAVAPSAPTINVHAPEKIETGRPAVFSAESSNAGVPALSYRWEFGDGTSLEGATVVHSYTHAGEFTVQITADGIEGIPLKQNLEVSVSGNIDTVFRPELYQRYTDQR
jgi:alpha-galactosidase